MQACSVHSWEGRLSHVRRPALKTKCLGFKTGSMTQGNPLPVSATAFHLQSRGEKNACLQDCLEDQGMCSKSTRVLAPVDFSNSNFKNRYLFIKVWMMYNQGFPGGSDSKESACNARDLGSIPGSGRSPGEGNGNPLQYSCLENPHGQRSLAGYRPRGCKRVRHNRVTKQQQHKMYNQQLSILTIGRMDDNCE